MHTTYIIDVDGVAIETPRDLAASLVDPEFWNSYWDNDEAQYSQLNPEVMCLAQGLFEAGYNVVFLTARPRDKAEVTAKVLRHGLHLWGGFVGQVVPLTDEGEPNPIKHNLAGDIPLMTWDRVGDDWAGTSEYKIKTMMRWEEDFKMSIACVLEDYKPNAEAIRKFWPVLLWERVK